MANIQSLRYKTTTMQAKLDYSTAKSAQLEKATKQWQDLLDQSQYLNKCLFKASAACSAPPSRHRLARKVQGGGAGRRMEGMVSPASTMRVPEMIMTSPKMTGEADDVLRYRLKELELKLEIQGLNNTHLQSLLQDQIALSKSPPKPSAPCPQLLADLRPAFRLYEGELLRRHDQLHSLNEVLSSWIHKYMELQDKVGIPTSSTGLKRSLSQEHVSALERLVVLTQDVEHGLKENWPAKGDESPPVYFNTD